MSKASTRVRFSDAPAVASSELLPLPPSIDVRAKPAPTTNVSAALPPKRRGVPEKATLPVLSVTVPALLPVTDQVVARSRPVSVEVVPLPTKAPTFDQPPLIGLAVPALAPASVKFAAPAAAERSSVFAAPVPPSRLPPSVPPPLKLKLSAAVPPASEKAPWKVVLPRPSLTVPLPLPVIVKVEPVLLPVRVVLVPFPTSVVMLL